MRNLNQSKIMKKCNKEAVNYLDLLPYFMNELNYTSKQTTKNVFKGLLIKDFIQEDLDIPKI